MFQFAFVAIFLFTSAMPSGWGGRVDPEPRTTNLQNVKINPICNFCLLFIKTIESLLPKEKTEQAIEDLMKKICNISPEHYRDTCNGFVQQYGKKLIELLISSMPPHVICTTLGLCLFPETQMPLSAKQTDCDSCKILALLSKFHLGQNTTDTQTSDLLKKICHLHPDAIPQCEGFVKIHGHRLLKTDGKQSPLTACQEDYICSGHKWN